MLVLGLLLGSLGALRAPPAAEATPSREQEPDIREGGVGICETTDWACVSECISEECADECLRKRCQRVLDALIICSRRTGCGPAEADASCIERNCDRLCEAAFGEPTKEQPKEAFDPCPTLKAPPVDVPDNLVGEWELSAASLEPPKDAGVKTEPEDREPRGDYARFLRITDRGCFVLTTPLQDESLGEGNRVTVRAWGTIQVDRRRIRFLTTDAHARGQACKVGVARELSEAKFVQPRFDWKIEADVLSLTGRDPQKTSFQFEKRK